jgi:hypothetical protein
MKKIYTSQDRLLVEYVKAMLESHGFDCVLKNQFLSSGVGDLPPVECWPEVWLLQDAQASHAAKLVEQLFVPAAGPAWQCPQCGEWHEAQFSDCWRCGKARL